MKKLFACVLLLFTVFSMVSLSATTGGNQAISLSLGYSNPRVKDSYFSNVKDNVVEYYPSKAFELTVGYERVVFDHVLILGRASYVKGKASFDLESQSSYGYTEGGSKVKKMEGSLTGFHSTVGICYKFNIDDKFSIYSGFSFGCYSLFLNDVTRTDRTWINSGYSDTVTETTAVGQFSSVSTGLGFILNTSFGINDLTSITFDFSVSFNDGSIVLSAGTKFKL